MVLKNLTKQLVNFTNDNDFLLSQSAPPGNQNTGSAKASQARVHRRLVPLVGKTDAHIFSAQRQRLVLPQPEQSERPETVLQLILAL